MEHGPGASVEVRGVTAGYRRPLGRRVVLRDVTLTLAPGTVTGLVGLNGVGKTTLLRILMGFLTPWAGEVRIAGERPRSYRRRRGVGYLPESVHLPGALTVEELLGVGVRLASQGGGPVPAGAIEGLLGMARLDGLRGRRPSGLSKGQARLVGLAWALTGRPELLLLDEPESGLDPLSRIALRAAMKEIVAEGCTVLVSSHDLSELEKVVGRVLVLDGGRLLREVRPGTGVDLESLLLGGPASTLEREPPA